MERLFSAEELKCILTEAELNEKLYLNTWVMDGNATALSIMIISAVNGLIFPEGNDHTGFEHLRERHASLVYKNYWIKGEEGQAKLDRPSKFKPGLIPAIDYVKIADSIFSRANKNITKNNRPDVFDKYTGIYADKDGKKEQYHLLTYRDTKIVHTLFPEKKKHNQKAVAKFGKGHVTTKRCFNGDQGYNYADLLVPYENSNGVTVYAILVRKFYQEQMERVFIIQYDNDENAKCEYLLGEREINDFASFDRDRISYFQYSDLVDYERIINKIHAGEEDIFIDPKVFKW